MKKKFAPPSFFMLLYHTNIYVDNSMLLVIRAMRENCIVAKL